MLRVGRSELPARWFREYMAYTPAVDLPRIRCRVLSITGCDDVQVDPGDVARIGELVRGEFTGETPARITHLLRRHHGPAGLHGYRSQLKHPVDHELLERVADWVAAPAR